MRPDPKREVDLFAPAYGRFHGTLHTEVRRDTWGEEFAPEIDDRVIESAGLRTFVKEDATDQVATDAHRWHEARAKREAGLRKAGRRVSLASNRGRDSTPIDVPGEIPVAPSVADLGNTGSTP